MVKIKGGLLTVIEQNCPVSFDAMYQGNIGQVTIYLDEPIEQRALRRLQTCIWKYIGDNLLQESYQTVKIFQ